MARGEATGARGWLGPARFDADSMGCTRNFVSQGMKLSEIRQHPLFPFADFRSSDASFLMLERHWTEVAREALGDELSRRCVPLQQCERDNGPEPSLNPVMVDFWIPEIRRGARVTLTENFDNAPLIEAAGGDERFAAYYPFVFYWQHRRITDPDDEIEQIVLCSDLSDRAVRGAQDGMRAFLVDRISLEAVDDLNRRALAALPNYPSPEEWNAYYARGDADGRDE